MGAHDDHPIRVEISDTQGHLRVDPEAVAALARRVLQGEGIDRAGLSIALVDDRTIAELNRRHLGHEGPTDVISFGLSEPGEPELAGELVVSAETAARTAGAAGIDPHAELFLYLTHGLLHLCGYDDRTDADQAVMRARERGALAREGLPHIFPLAEPERSGRGEPECVP